MKKITIMMILTLVLALTATVALAANSGLSDPTARIEKRIESFEGDVQSLLASAPKPLTGNPDSTAIEARDKEMSDFVAKFEQKTSNLETDLQGILESAKPQKAVSEKMYHYPQFSDPERDDIWQQYGF